LLLKLNINKCNLVFCEYHINSINDYYLQSEGSVSVLEHINNMKDLDITFDSGLKFYLHVDEKINKSHSVLCLIHRNFKHMSATTFIMLYKTSVRSHLEYAYCVVCMVSIQTDGCRESGKGTDESYANNRTVKKLLI